LDCESSLAQLAGQGGNDYKGLFHGRGLQNGMSKENIKPPVCRILHHGAAAAAVAHQRVQLASTRSSPVQFCKTTSLCTIASPFEGTNRKEEVAELLVAPAQLGGSSSTVDFEDEICHFEASKKQRLALSCIAKQGKEIETRNDPLHTSELGTPKAQEPSASEAIEIKTKLGDEISQLDKWNHTKYHAVGAYPVANRVPSNNIFVSNRIGKMGSNSYSANTNGCTVSHEPSFSCTPAGLSEKEIHLRPRWQKGSEALMSYGQKKKEQGTKEYEYVEGAGDVRSNELVLTEARKKFSTSPRSDELANCHSGSIQRTVPKKLLCENSEEPSCESPGAQLLRTQKEFQQYMLKCQDDLHREFKDFKGSITRQLIALQMEIQRVLAFHDLREDPVPFHCQKDRSSTPRGVQARLDITEEADDHFSESSFKELPNDSKDDMEIARIPSLWSDNCQPSTATKGAAKFNSQLLCESEVPLQAVKSLPQRETGEEKVNCWRKDTGESESSTTNAACHGVSHSNLDESSYLGSFEEIEHMLLTGGSLLGSDSGRVKSVSRLLDHDSLLGQSAPRVLGGLGNIRRITETVVTDEDSSGNPPSRMANSLVSGKGSLSYQVPQVKVSPAKEQVIYNVKAASSTEVTGCTGNPVTLGHPGDSSAIRKIDKKEASTFAPKTPPELHYSLRKKPIPLSIVSNTDKLNCPAIITSSGISPKKRVESQSNPRSSVLYRHLSAEPEKAATRGERERHDEGEQLSLAGKGDTQNFPMSIQEEKGVFQQADVGVSRSQFTLHGWAAAFLRPLEKAPKGEQSEHCMGVSKQQSEVEASIDMVHPIPKGTGSSCKLDPSTHEHGDSRTSSLSSSQWNLDMNFPGKRSKGGCAWTVDDLTQTKLVE